MNPTGESEWLALLDRRDLRDLGLRREPRPDPDKLPVYSFGYIARKLTTWCTSCPSFLLTSKKPTAPLPATGPASLAHGDVSNAPRSRPKNGGRTTGGSRRLAWPPCAPSSKRNAPFKRRRLSRGRAQLSCGRTIV
jgi:hypothetical protein